jgi:hypothetical protein
MATPSSAEGASRKRAPIREAELRADLVPFRAPGRGEEERIDHDRVARVAVVDGDREEIAGQRELPGDRHAMRVADHDRAVAEEESAVAIDQLEGRVGRIEPGRSVARRDPGRNGEGT